MYGLGGGGAESEPAAHFCTFLQPGLAEPFAGLAPCRGAVAGETQHPLLSRWALEGPVQPLTQGEAHSGAGRGSQGSRTHVGEPAWKRKSVPRGVWEPAWGSIRCPTVTE